MHFLSSLFLYPTRHEQDGKLQEWSGRTPTSLLWGRGIQGTERQSWFGEPSRRETDLLLNPAKWRTIWLAARNREYTAAAGPPTGDGVHEAWAQP